MARTEAQARTAEDSMALGATFHQPSSKAVDESSNLLAFQGLCFGGVSVLLRGPTATWLWGLEQRM